MLGHSQQPASPQMPSVCMLGMVCRTTCRTGGHTIRIEFVTIYIQILLLQCVDDVRFFSRAYS